MSTTLCPACRAIVAEDQNACPRCGLAFAPGAVVSPLPLAAMRPGVPSLSTPPAPAHPRSPPSGTDPYLGTVVAGRFRVDALIGAGGMGKVYRATHLGLDKTVCLKTLKPSLTEDQTVIGRFEREAKAASRLDHPNSIQVLDFGQDERGNLFLVMEFVPGRDLRQLLRAEFPLPEPRVARLVAQVLAALARAHAQGVVHRDLKPENILVCDRPDEPDFVKVLDFGIAKILDPTTPGLTRNDMVCGTPEYMSPEQALGKDVDARADLYAVGVILYQCFAGFLPFDGHNAMEVLQHQVNDAPRPPREAFPQTTASPAMEALILRALEKLPAKRPQTAEAFRRELLSLAGLATPPSEARSVPPPLDADAVTTPEHVRVPGPPAREGVPYRKPPPSESADDFERFVAPSRSRLPVFASIVGVLALVLAGLSYFKPRVPPPDPDLVQEPLKPPEPGGTLTQSEAYDVIESHQKLVEHCFLLARKSIAHQSGEIVLSLGIGADGKVTLANIPSSTPPLPRIERCLVRHAKLWTFPPPQRAPMLLSYTYRFRG